MKVFFYAILERLFTLFVCLFVNWWAPIFATNEARLPNWLKWCDTFDADLDTGNREMEWGQGYLGRVRWLYRNPAYGFDYWFLGRTFNPEEWKTVEFVEEPFRFKAVGPKGQFNLHFVRFGIRFKFGWKAWNMYNKSNGNWLDKPWGPEMRIPFVCSFSLA